MPKQKAAEAKPKKAKTIEIHPKEIAQKKARELKQDTYAYIWIIFIIALALMTLYFKMYIKEMINVSALFILFWYLEPLMFGVTGTTATTILGKGKFIPAWKRFPLFFLVIIFVYVLYNGVKMVLDIAFPEEHVNFVFVIMWLGLLYLLWIYKFSKELGVEG
ncbi:MAG: hypothetical protein QXU82_03425 [Candidatus Aenigmatarchaeota archaeon]